MIKINCKDEQGYQKYKRQKKNKCKRIETSKLFLKFTFHLLRKNNLFEISLSRRNISSKCPESSVSLSKLFLIFFTISLNNNRSALLFIWPSLISSRSSSNSYLRSLTLKKKSTPYICINFSGGNFFV